MIVPISSLDWGVASDGGYLRAEVASTKLAALAAESVEEGKAYEIEIRPARKKRSLDANSYMWLLLGKLTAVLNGQGRCVTKEDVYRECIREVGDNFYIEPVREDAVEHWCYIWRAHGEGWITEILGASKLPGYVNVVCYYGSSVYTTEQMKRLIDIVIAECKEQGVETMTPEQLARLTEG